LLGLSGDLRIRENIEALSLIFNAASDEAQQPVALLSFAKVMVSQG
jgi:hypothetical protein